MKLILVMATILLSGQTMSAEVILKLSTGGGFAPIAMSTQLTVSDDGQVNETKRRGATLTTVKIAKLSANAVQGLKDKIETISDNAKLVDLTPKAPGCMDAPSSTYSVIKGGQEIIIAAKRNCRPYEVKEAEAKELVKVLQTFNYLSN